MGADGDVPRERPLGGRSHLRPVADGGAEDVQVRERRAGPGGAGVPGERGPAGRLRGAGPLRRLPLRLRPRTARGGERRPAAFVSRQRGQSGAGKVLWMGRPGGGTGGRLLSKAQERNAGQARGL